jgi:hypothetical protein
VYTYNVHLTPRLVKKTLKKDLMYNKNIVRRPLKDLTVSATLKKMMDFSEVTGDREEPPGQISGRRLGRIRGHCLFATYSSTGWWERNANHSLSMTPMESYGFIRLWRAYPPQAWLNDLRSVKQILYSFPILILMPGPV